MSDTDYELHINRSLYESLWEDGDDLPVCGGDPDDIDKIITEEMAASRRRRRRKVVSR